MNLINAVYGYFCFCTLGNLLLMRRPKAGATTDKKATVLIPARNEAHNLAELLPQIVPQAQVIVFDDESTDGTADVARRLGATVLRPSQPLPKGWTGKNRACHELGRAAAEGSDADYWIFLDADVRISPDFVAKTLALATKMPPKWAVLTGFPTIVPGRFPEPVFLAWVGWILLATNPFFLVARTRMGHNMFTNGQITCWKPAVYCELWPNEVLKNRVLEDVAIGRLLAKHGYGIEVANLSSIMRVKMYDTWQQALDGMSKNSFEIAGSVGGSVLVALLLAALSFGWMLSFPLAYGLLVISMMAAGLTVGAHPVRMLLSSLFLSPIALLIGGFTVLRSTGWKLKGKTTWKGRTY